MSSGARVQSVDALERFRAALGVFREEAGVALGEVSAELTRFSDWLEHDQLDYWKQELRRREDQVVEARLELSRCLSATLDPERTPSCHDEKKRLQRAKERVVAAETRLGAVRHWIGQVRQAIVEYRGRTEALAAALESDLPVAAAQLDRLMARIDDYLSVTLAPAPVAPLAAGAVQHELAGSPFAQDLAESPTPEPPGGEDSQAADEPAVDQHSVSRGESA
jgi:hypothetical protein